MSRYMNVLNVLEGVSRSFLTGCWQFKQAFLLCYLNLCSKNFLLLWCIYMKVNMYIKGILICKNVHWLDLKLLCKVMLMIFCFWSMWRKQTFQTFIHFFQHLLMYTCDTYTRILIFNCVSSKCMFVHTFYTSIYLT